MGRSVLVSGLRVLAFLALAALVGGGDAGAEDAAGIRVAAGASAKVICLGRRLSAVSVDATRQQLACEGERTHAKPAEATSAIALQPGQRVSALCAGPRLVVGNRARRDATLFCEALPSVSAAPALHESIPELSEAAGRGSAATRTER